MVTLSLAGFLVEAIGPAQKADCMAACAEGPQVGWLAHFRVALMRGLIGTRAVAAGFGPGRMIDGAV